MTRKTDEEFLGEIDALEKQESYSLAAMRATREAMRARASEDGLRAALAQKDETIKATNDLLSRVERALSFDPKHNAWDLGPSSLLVDVRAALRMAGVLK